MGQDTRNEKRARLLFVARVTHPAHSTVMAKIRAQRESRVSVLETSYMAASRKVATTPRGLHVVIALWKPAMRWRSTYTVMKTFSQQ